MLHLKINYGAVALTVSIFGSLYVAVKYITDSISSLSLLFFRFLIASVILIAVARRRGLEPVRKKDFPMLLAIGFAGYFLSNAALMLGVQYSNASASSLINSTTPVFVVLFAWLILREPLTVRKMAAILLAVTGAAVIIGGSFQGSQMTGMLFSITSVLIWSLVTILIKKMTVRYHPIVITAYGMLIACICSFPIAVYDLTHTADLSRVNAVTVMSVLYVGLICTAFAHVLWNECLSRLGAGNCAIFYPIQLIVSALLGVLILHETLDRRFLAGAALIISGILLNVVRERNSKSRRTARPAHKPRNA